MQKFQRHKTKYQKNYYFSLIYWNLYQGKTESTLCVELGLVYKYIFFTSYIE